MQELDNYRYPYHRSVYPPFCFCLALGISVGGVTLSAIYNTVDHFGSFAVYSFLCVLIGLGAHFQGPPAHTYDPDEDSYTESYADAYEDDE